MPPARRPQPVDDALAQLVDSWNRLRPAAHLEQRVAEDAERGPEHLVRIVQALELSARQTGGSLSEVTEQLTAGKDSDGALHHMVELMQHGGASAAVAVARQLDSNGRSQVLARLRSLWQAPMRHLSRPLDERPPQQRAFWRA